MLDSLKTFLRRLYHVLFYLPAQRAIQRMIDDGLPAELVPAFRYLAQPTVATADKRVLAPIRNFRAALRHRTDSPIGAIVSSDLKTGSARDPDRPQVAGFSAIPWQTLAKETSVSHYWGVFLFLCAKHKQPALQTILELGSGVGISACYLTAGNPNAQLITVEGSPQRAAMAEANLRQMNPRARVVNALFDDALDEWLSKLSGTLDLVHIDGHHQRDATLHYFERLKPHLRPGALLIFDDIRWSDEMRRTWAELSASRDVSFAIDTGRYGLCLYQSGAAHPCVHDFSRYTTDWKEEHKVYQVS